MNGKLKETVARLEAELAKDPNYDFIEGAAKADVATIVTALKIVDAQHQLIADLHNGFTINVSGNPQSIDVLRQELVKDTLVKSIRVFSTEVGDYIYKANYTQLKEIRKALGHDEG